jgi:hypothetical protein
MRAIEFITEVFAPGKTNWKWRHRGSEEATADFTVGDRTYQWHAYSHVRAGNPTKWEMQFRLIRSPNDPDDLDLFGTTGTGNSTEVLSTAVDITREFLKQYGLDKVEEITFSAKENSRIALYAKMIKRLLPDWDLYQKYTEYNGMEYHLTDRRAYDKPENKIAEEIIDEMPLPADWDPQQMRQQTTSFKSRLAYALERAKKLGTGSSRVATIIEYEGRPTVLKIAKNAKGLSQNSVEADILSDGYASQLGILIPIIDYDEQNREPSWVHTEMAQKVTEKQLCVLMGCKNLSQLISLAHGIAGKKGLTYQSVVQYLRRDGNSEEEIEKMTDYANTLADLNNSFDVELGDFTRAANWGLYQGKPVIIDVGFNSNVLNQYYKR